MMPRRYWLLIGPAAIVILLATLWFFARPTGLTGATICIGAITPLTGPFDAYGEPVRDGIARCQAFLGPRGRTRGTYARISPTSIWMGTGPVEGFCPTSWRTAASGAGAPSARIT